MAENMLGLGRTTLCTEKEYTPLLTEDLIQGFIKRTKNMDMGNIRLLTERYIKVCLKMGNKMDLVSLCHRKERGSGGFGTKGSDKGSG
jgi:hypothetical protein